MPGIFHQAGCCCPPACACPGDPCQHCPDTTPDSYRVDLGDVGPGTICAVQSAGKGCGTDDCCWYGYKDVDGTIWSVTVWVDAGPVMDIQIWADPPDEEQFNEEIDIDDCCGGPYSFSQDVEVTSCCP